GVLCTNPIGASGMLRLGEAALQVMGRAGAHQVEGAKTALGHAYGGGAQYFAMWIVGSERWTMSGPAVLYEKKGGIAFVTMKRPEVRNAINTEMLCRLADAWQDINDADGVRVAILSGAGDKAFCAGADLDRLVRMLQGLRPPETEFDERVRNDHTII